MKSTSKVLNMFGPLSFTALLGLATVCFCFGCDKKQGIETGDTPPAISGNDIHGKVVNLAQLKGKIVVIYFWTNSCCGSSVKELETIYRKNKHKGLEVLAIDEIDSKKDVESFAKSNGLSFTILMDEHSSFLKQYQVFAFPTIFIIDGNGILRKKILGDIGGAQLEKQALRLLDLQKKAEESYEKVHAR
ncbi:MAG: alkyl hydroperoxide reductase/thiol specific antioxidant/Mal allergen [uncultured bacterium]|nr:MAG: alkyl hydroperoxide reductase/thiol specific antioxidant/Mal allergen [uncultured bacterium]